MPLSVEAAITVPGMHFWPTAPDRREYLRSPHRHLFHVTAEVKVDYADRAVEFHDLQDAIHQIVMQRNLLGSAENPVAASCETMASLIEGYLRDRHYDPIHVAVSEDGENTGHWRA